jgi:hypothetical protein
VSRPRRSRLPRRAKIAALVYHSATPLVQRHESEALKVFPFGMMQAEGVIDGLTKPFHDRNLPSRIDGRSEDDFLEQIDRYMLRAGKREKDSARVQVTQRMEV